MRSNEISRRAEQAARADNEISQLIGIAEIPARADKAHEQIDSGIRMGDSTVMLSTAKHLAAQRDRPFAAAQGDSGGADLICYMPLLRSAGTSMQDIRAQ